MAIDKKQLIIQLMSDDIDLFGFFDIFEKTYGKLDICKELEMAIKNKDSDLIDCFLYLGAKTNYDYYCVETLNQLIISEWHQKHEDLAGLLSQYGDETSINYLYKAALLTLEYRDYDEDYVLADKCIRALAKINHEEAVDKLKLLAKARNNLIKEKAEKQLRKLLG